MPESMRRRSATAPYPSKSCGPSSRATDRGRHRREQQQVQLAAREAGLLVRGRRELVMSALAVAACQPQHLGGVERAGHLRPPGREPGLAAGPAKGSREEFRGRGVKVVAEVVREDDGGADVSCCHRLGDREHALRRRAVRRQRQRPGRVRVQGGLQSAQQRVGRAVVGDEPPFRRDHPVDRIQAPRMRKTRKPVRSVACLPELLSVGYRTASAKCHPGTRPTCQASTGIAHLLASTHGAHTGRKRPHKKDLRRIKPQVRTGAPPGTRPRTRG